jgi:hypothetical protein
MALSSATARAKQEIVNAVSDDGPSSPSPMRFDGSARFGHVNFNQAVHRVSAAVQLHPVDTLTL